MDPYSLLEKVVGWGGMGGVNDAAILLIDATT